MRLFHGMGIGTKDVDRRMVAAWQSDDVDWEVARVPQQESDSH